LEAAASIWTVAAIGLAVGGGLYFAAGLSTTIILAVLAGVKPLEEAYRDRNQTCQLVIETVRGTLTPEILKDALKVRNGQNTVVNLKGRLTNLPSGFIQGI
jgi:putative Mg2+ transporter-C (MgtC) family protein